MTLDAPSQAFLETLSRQPRKPRQEMSAMDARLALQRVCEQLGTGPQMHRIHDLSIPTFDGASIRSRVYIPTSARCQGAIVYFHGGGWVTGSLAEFEPMARSIARECACVVALVEYRKAPEHPYPTPVEDAWTAMLWMERYLQSIVTYPLPFLVGGDSAGANLAIAVTFRARQHRRPILVGQLLVYPVTDSDLNRPSYLDPANQLLLNREGMAWYWDHYVPDVAYRSEPEASPLRNISLEGLPAAVVLTAEHDVLLDEGEAYVHRLRNAGVEVAHQRFDGQMHGFLMMIDMLPASAAGIAYLGSEIKRLLASSQTRLGAQWRNQQ